MLDLQIKAGVFNNCFYQLSQMFPSIFNFSLINYNPFCYGMYMEHLMYPAIQTFPYLENQDPQNSQSIEDVDDQMSFKLTLTREDLQIQGLGISKKHWSQQQDKLLKEYSQLYNFDWCLICKKLPGRNQKMCYSRYRRIQNEAKTYWTQKENQEIKKYFQEDKMSWKSISKLFPNRTAKQIREHYLNFLRPNIKREQWTIEQDLKIIKLYNQHGKKWKMFEKNFEGRTENQIKNRFYGRLKRLQMKKQNSMLSGS